VCYCDDDDDDVLLRYEMIGAVALAVAYAGGPAFVLLRPAVRLRLDD
jgi:hypothetical protein